MNRMIPALLLAFLLASPAGAQVGLGATCEGDSVRIGVYVTMNTFVEEPAGHGIVVLAYLVGTCRPPFVFSPEPLPMPAFMTSAEFTFVAPNPDPGKTYMYQAHGLDPEENLYTLPPAGDVLNIGFCGGPDAIVARGYLHAYGPGYCEFEPCPDSCWYATEYACTVDLKGAEPGWQALVDSGRLVNLYGQAIASRVEIENDALGCAAVSVIPSTWGSLKATYR